MIILLKRDTQTLTSTDLKFIDIQDGKITKAEILTAPYVINPSLGERLDFIYAFPSESRVIIRVFSLDGRFITSIVDKYYESGGVILREEDSSDWNGRDHLGQIVSPGTYIMHML